MTAIDAWQYNEMRQIGTDYGSEAEVQAYDERMSRLRDIRSETVRIIEALELKKQHTVLEVGTGTGECATELSMHCKRVIAVDVSKKMLAYARKKAERRNASNITFQHGGFLTYVHRDEPVDAVISQLALHHLPDFWKGIALVNIHQLLREGGRLYLHDVVFSFPLVKYQEAIESFIMQTEETAGKEIADEIKNHVREEYSTFTWIMEELLLRSGFRIDRAEYRNEFFATYFCTRE
jgi:putative AdoMet-dependent methyltransferase